MKSGLARWRFELVFGLLLAALAGLSVRMGLLIKDEKIRRKAATSALIQAKIVIPVPARPGYIFARSNKSSVLLAGSRQSPGCFADPGRIHDAKLAEVAQKLGPILEMDPATIQEKIINRRDAESGRSFIWLKKDLSLAKAEAVEALKIDGIGVRQEWRRNYPNGNLASNLLGFRLLDNTAGEGLELSFDKYLREKDGQRVVIANTKREGIWENESYPAQDGGNVYTCLDATIQGALEKAVATAVQKSKAEWGTGIVINPHTGDILAVVSIPDYDPNAYNTSKPENRTNRAINVPYEPGSAFKPVMAAAAVNDGVLTWQTKLNCEGGVYNAYKAGVISDHGAHYGLLSLWDIIVFSSNIGMAKVGEKLGNYRLKTLCEAWGFGHETGIELSGESRGIVRSPITKWDGYSTRRVPFGQEISVTALQLAMAYGAMANGGMLMKPRLVDCVTDAAGAIVWRSQPQAVRRVLNKPVADETLLALQDVVERGTGKACRMEKWTVGGKTGTAQISQPGRGYIDGAFTGTFVGVAPISEPRFVCLISIYWPKQGSHYGAVVAAPYVKDVLETSLTAYNVPPDKDPSKTPAASSEKVHGN